MGWQWQQLDHMQIICTSFQTDNHASTSPLMFLQAGWPSCRPTNSVRALKAICDHFTLRNSKRRLDDSQLQLDKCSEHEITTEMITAIIVCRQDAGVSVYH